MLVYTIWTEPYRITSFFDKTKNSVSGFATLDNSEKPDFSNVKYIDSNSDQINEIKRVDETPQAEKEDSLLKECKSSFEQCKEITNAKYDISISIIKIEKFANEENATDFYNTWKGPFQIPLQYLLERIEQGKSFPVVLFAVKVSGKLGDLPAVIICDKDGNIIRPSKDELQC